MTVQTLSQRLDEVIKQNTELNNIVMQNQKLLNDLLNQSNTTPAATVSQNLADLKDVRDELKQATSSVRKIASQIDTDADETEDEDDEDAEPKGSLLIGDSLIRSLQSTSEDLEITCLSGAKLMDIKKKLKRINTKKVKYADMYIVAGTNDASCY